MNIAENIAMTGAAWTVLWPLITIAAAAIVAMVGIAFHRSHGLTLGITLAGLGLAIGELIPAASLVPRDVTPLLRIDGFALFFIGLTAGSAFTVALLARAYLNRQQVAKEEFYILLLTATLGAAVLAASNHFASFFLGLEILSVSLYGLNAYLQRKALPLEAGIKYLVLAASSAAFLLFGMALVYASTGTMNFPALAAALQPAAHLHTALVVPGLVLILVGIGFKLGVVPFHLWTPDVYQGAPAPVTAFIATASKAAIFAVLLRLVAELGGNRSTGLAAVIAVVAIASMVAGNLLALRQRNVKRILAYSSIAHMGYLLVPLEAAGASLNLAVAAIGFYFLAYFIATLGAFGIISALSSSDGEPDTIADYRGLFWRRPGLALVFIAMLLSLAGIPLTAGFIAKFYIVAAGASALLWALLLVLVITSVVGLFYYLRIVVALCAAPETSPTAEPAAVALWRPVARTDGWVLALLLIALVWIGVYPQPFLHLVLHLQLR